MRRRKREREYEVRRPNKPNGQGTRYRTDKRQDRWAEKRISALNGQAILQTDRSVSDANPNSNHIMQKKQGRHLSRSRRCRGHFGPATSCPTQTTEGNARLKRLCSGPQNQQRRDRVPRRSTRNQTRRRVGTQMLRDLQGGIAWAGMEGDPVAPLPCCPVNPRRRPRPPSTNTEQH